MLLSRRRLDHFQDRLPLRLQRLLCRPKNPDDSPATKAPDPPKPEDTKEPAKDKARSSADEPYAKSKSETKSAEKAPDARGAPLEPTTDGEESQSAPVVQAGLASNAAPTDPGKSPASAATPEKYTEDT